MEIIVGRRGNQKITITDTTVSREHCKLTSNADGTYTLENLSQNGTFVDDRSVIRSIVTQDTVIRLGATYTVAIKDLLPVTHQVSSSSQPQQVSKNNVDPKDAEYKLEFQKLKAVYEKYTAEKLAIQKETARNNFYRMLPMSLLALVGLGATAIPSLGNIAPYIGGAGAVLLVYSLVKSFGGTNETHEKLQALDDQFKINYVCPKCGNFLGYVPYETLKNKKTCNFCKCKWV